MGRVPTVRAPHQLLMIIIITESPFKYLKDPNMLSSTNSQKIIDEFVILGSLKTLIMWNKVEYVKGSLDYHYCSSSIVIKYVTSKPGIEHTIWPLLSQNICGHSTLHPHLLPLDQINNAGCIWTRVSHSSCCVSYIALHVDVTIHNHPKRCWTLRTSASHVNREMVCPIDRYLTITIVINIIVSAYH